ncbi:hypothetical protein BH10PSE2_BH10PSE2_00020 [soil metagenome]
MPSKAFVRLRDRSSAYDTDLELADVLVRAFMRSQNTDQTIAEAAGVESVKYLKLSSRKNNKQSRKVIGRHLVNSIGVAYIKEIYEDFTEYLQVSVRRATLSGLNVDRFIGSDNFDFSSKEILKAKNWDSVVELVSDKLFRSLESEKSTISLIKKIIKKLGLDVDAGVVTAALPYLDARHVLVHRDGLADEFYKKAHPNVHLIDGFIVTNFAFVNSARVAIMTLAERLDETLIEKGFVRESDMAGA